MTQLGKFKDSMLPAYQRVIQLWMQFCRHLQNLSWGPGFHEEGAAVDITHLAFIILEALRLVGVGHKAQLKVEQCIGVGLGTVYQVDQATWLVVHPRRATAARMACWQILLAHNA